MHTNLRAMRRPLVSILPRVVQKTPKWRFSTFNSHKDATSPASGFGLQRAAETSKPVEKQLSEPLFRDTLIYKRVPPLWLRDACKCELCVDPSSKQKRFQTSDIPLEIDYVAEKVGPNGPFNVIWSNDMPGFGSNHVSTFSEEFLSLYRKSSTESIWHTRSLGQVPWDKAKITDSVKFVDFSHYMMHDSVLHEVLKQLREHGLVFLGNVPESEKAIEEVAGRIGPLKNTFYGLTWDVKSVPKAKNIAYTHQYLGLHMDLLYTDHPPALQLLHCLKNSCEGGTSLFCDSHQAAFQLRKSDRKAFDSLKTHNTTFEYDNAGEYYCQHRRVIELDEGHEYIKDVNWSPPFQAPFRLQGGILDNNGAAIFTTYMQALKKFAARIEASENIYKYRLQEGECVIFDNKRVLHARTAFDISSGERWLKGAYLDGDVWFSRQVVLDRKFNPAAVPVS